VKSGSENEKRKQLNLIIELKHCRNKSTIVNCLSKNNFMKYAILLSLIFSAQFSLAQKMDKPDIDKKRRDTTWRTKSEYIFKAKKPMSGENDLSVFTYAMSSNRQISLWFNGSFYARVIFTVNKNDRLDITFTDGTKDSLFADDDQKSGVSPFGENRTSWFSVYDLNDTNINNLATKDIASLYLIAGPYHFTFAIEPEKKEIIKKQILLLRNKTNY